MSDTIISVENLSKRYLVAHQSKRDRHSTLRDAIVREARSFARKAADLVRGRQIVQGDEVEEFWALRNVSFEVKQGDVIGIIGRNGAGKSTLLKILSRITEPTEGRVTLHGRVASLLEVGTGFHPELTGRENIFLNGAILGMTQREVHRKFDEIVAFAEVERFLDTPVKHYSSGMYVRLAFAVAAHLEPEILVVDEVLAVGDAEFQRKCLGKMSEVSHQRGRTILFVTHDMEKIAKLCNLAILLNAGQVKTAGETKSVLSAYFMTSSISSRTVDLRNAIRGGHFSGIARFVQAATCDGKPDWSFRFGEDIGFELLVDAERELDEIEIAIGLYSVRGFEVASWTNVCAGTKLGLSAGHNKFRISYGDMRLLPGQYYLGMDIRLRQASEDYIPNALSFEVTPSAESGVINAHSLGGAFIPSASISKLE